MNPAPDGFVEDAFDLAAADPSNARPQMKRTNTPSAEPAQNALAVRGMPQPGPGAGPTRDYAQNIVWISSYPKSGNTWVRAFIHNLLKELAGDPGDAQDINKMSEHTVWEFSGEHFERTIRKPIAKMSLREIAKVRPEVQRQLAMARPGPFFVKTHMCVGHDFQYPTINLNVTLAAIHVVRNPLDVAVSFARYSDKSIDTAIAIMGIEDFKSSVTERTVSEFMGSWSQNVASWIGQTTRAVHVMRYEDMLANPLRPFSNLARFLRLSPTEAQLRAAIAKSSFAELSRQETERGFNEKPSTAQRFFREGRAGQWQEVLTRDQVREVIRTHAPTMQRFGYLPPDCGMPILRPHGANMASWQPPDARQHSDQPPG